MNSLQLEKIGLLSLKKAKVPVPESGEILLKITHCAVCRTDAKMWKQGQRDLVLPRILGHEICGRIPGSKNFYTVWPGSACGSCGQCRNGAENLCKNMRITGFHKDGGFAEYVSVPESSLIPVPEGLSSDIACLAEPMACTLNALEQSRIRKGDKILIYGAGPLGLMTAITAQSLGGVPFIKEINPARLIQSKEFFKRISIKQCPDDMEKDFDIIINAAPSSEILADALPRLRSGGCFCLFSGLTDDRPIAVSAFNEIHYRQLNLTGAYGCTKRQMEKALKILYHYKDDVPLLIEKHISLEQVPDILPEILAGKSLKFIITQSETRNK